MIEIKSPIDLAVEVNYSCNLNCSYCYAYPRSGRNPTTKEVKQILDYAIDKIKPFELVLSGGEPFLRRDFLDILEYVCKRGNMDIDIVTNGTLISRKIARELKNLQKERHFGIQVSLDSHIEEVHNRVRKKYAKTKRGLEYLTDEGVTFIIGTVVHKQNIDTLLESIDEFYFLGYKNLHFMNIMPSRQYLHNFDQLKVSNEILRDFWRKALQKVKPYADLVFMHPYIDEDKSLNATLKCNGCLAGTTRAVILPNSDFIPCDMTRDYILGNIFTNSWEDIWYSEQAERIRQENAPLCSLDSKHEWLEKI